MSGIFVDQTPIPLFSEEMMQKIYDSQTASSCALASAPAMPFDYRKASSFLDKLSTPTPISTRTVTSFPSSGQTTPSPSPIDIWDASSVRAPINDWDIFSNRVSRYRSRERVIIPNETANLCCQHADYADLFCRNVLKQHPVKSSSSTINIYLHHYALPGGACWSPRDEGVIIGDTDRKIFNPLDQIETILAHEFGHAFIQYSGGLATRGETGALSESIADVFAIMSQQYRLKKRANDPTTSWLIGEGLMVADRAKGALRSMDAPGTAYDNTVLDSDLQPDHMTGFVKTKLNRGGVHINCGIPNRAFSLAAKGDQGFSWERIGKVWMQALEESPSRTSFSNFAGRTVKIAHSEYGGDVGNIVGQAWMRVGVDISTEHSGLQMTLVGATGLTAGVVGGIGGLTTGALFAALIYGNQAPITTREVIFILGSGIVGGALSGKVVADIVSKAVDQPNLKAQGVKL